MEFRILGPLDVRANGHRLELGGPKQRALLALLLLSANEVVSRETLIESLWGEAPPPSASHTLDAYVSRLRKVLRNGDDSHDRLLTRPPGYVLRVAPGEVDLLRFEQLAADARRAIDDGHTQVASISLREAERLWRGRALADLEFEPPAHSQIERLEQLRLATVEQRVEADLALGRHEQLVPELNELVRAHPLRERLRAQLMLALYRSDRQADALRAYREARDFLREELGLDPSPRLQELERAVLLHAPTLDPPPLPTAADRRDGADADKPHPRPARTAARRRALTVLAAFAAIVTAIVVTQVRGAAPEHPAVVAGNEVVAMNVAGDHAVAAIPLGSRPAAAAYGTGAIWVATPDANAVARIDPVSRTVRQTIRIEGAPSALAVGAGSIWVADYLGAAASRVDPQTQTVVQTVAVGGGPSAVAVGNSQVWVANTLGSSVSRINPHTGALIGTTAIGLRPDALAVGAGAVWVASESEDRVLRIDPGTGAVQGAVPVGTGPTAITVARGAVWVVNRLDGTISRIDPARDIVTDTIAVGDGPTDITTMSGSLWVSNGLDGTLTEVDPSTRVVRRTIRIGGEPQALVAAGSTLLVGLGASGAAHRGGSLTLLDQDPDFDSLDPAILLSLAPTQLLGLTNDGLVTFNHVGAAAGLQLVPDLAVSLPTPTDGGTTYSFKVRPNVRYSTGPLVAARDFRYALERVFRLRSPVARLYAGIVGADRCQAHPESCDLSHGVVADDLASRVTFHLVAPDPDFLQKLALPYTYAVPAGTAPDEAARTSLPATGPYVIQSYQPGEQLTLVRNPRFREWSRAAQPDGYADRIVWKLGVRLDNALSAIERGKADWVLNYGPLPADRRREIATQYASQTHAELVPGTYYYFMNVRVPPFNDPGVRRALNYALDRTALARVYAARPACQVVPPQLPGYSPYCPYTTNPGASGRWRGPDLARARRLIAASGTSGMRVRVVNDVHTPDVDVIVKLLQTLGYHASPWIVPGRRYGLTISDSRKRVQIGNGGWTSDYPAPSDFFDLKFSCRAYRPASPFNNDDSEFCDRRIEAQANRARLLGLTNPAASERAWASVYRRIVDEAPWLPTVTPTWTDFVSRRVGNYQFHPLWGILIDQLWVR